MFLNSARLASLRFFEVAARTLSFRRAALELHVTQGAVSQHIKHLEEALGCKLFYRLPRQVRLTEEGRGLAAAVEQSLALIEQEARSILIARSNIEIRLRAGPSFALRWLVPRLGDFYARHPDIKLFTTAAYDQIDAAQCEFDLAIEMIPGKVPGLQSEVLLEEFLVPVCSPQYLAMHGPLERVEDLARCTLLHDAHPWLGASQDAEWRYWLSEVGGELDCSRGQFFTLANLSLEAALTHQGVAMGRIALIQDWLAAGRLVAPFGRPVRSLNRYCLVYPKEAAGRAGVQAVMGWLREQAGKKAP